MLSGVVYDLRDAARSILRDRAFSEAAPADRGSVGAATVLMIAITITSTMAPVIRAIRIQPASALRDE